MNHLKILYIINQVGVTLVLAIVGVFLVAKKWLPEPPMFDLNQLTGLVYLALGLIFFEIFERVMREEKI